MLLNKNEVINVLQEHCKITDLELIDLGIKKRQEEALVTRLTDSQKEWLLTYCYLHNITVKKFFTTGILNMILGKENIQNVRMYSMKKNTDKLERVCQVVIDTEIANIFKKFCYENGISHYSRALRGYCLLKEEEAK